MLDARLISMVGEAAFEAELANGHRVVAYFADKKYADRAGFKPGDMVRLEMSPFDMSQGRIVPERGESR